MLRQSLRQKNIALFVRKILERYINPDLGRSPEWVGMASARELYNVSKVSAMNTEKIVEDFYRAIDLIIGVNVDHVDEMLAKAASMGATVCNSVILGVMPHYLKCGTAVMDEWNPRWKELMSGQVVLGVVDNLQSRGFSVHPTNIPNKLRIEWDTHKRNMRRWRGVVRFMVAMSHWRRDYYRPGAKGANAAIARATYASLQ
jgi:hypothetical protein